MLQVKEDISGIKRGVNINILCGIKRGVNMNILSKVKSSSRERVVKMEMV